MNKAILIGRLTRDPELRYTSGNTPVANFSIAVNRPFTNQAGEREADFLNIIVWRKNAENVKNYLSKGSQVAVEGRIQTRTYDDTDGKKRYVTEIVADNVQFLDTRNNSGDMNNYNSYGNSGNEVSPYDFPSEEEPKKTDISKDPYEDMGASMQISDDELPF